MGFFSVNTNTLYYEIGLNNKISFKHKILKIKSLVLWIVLMNLFLYKELILPDLK